MQSINVSAIFCIQLWSNTPVITLNILATSQDSPQNLPTASEVLACASIFVLLIFTSWRPEPSASSKLRSHRLPMKLHVMKQSGKMHLVLMGKKKKDLSFACLNESLHSFDRNITLLEKNSCINVQIAKLQKLSRVWLHMHIYLKNVKYHINLQLKHFTLHSHELWTSTTHDNRK